MIDPKQIASWSAIAVSLLIGFEGLVHRGYHDKIDPKGVNTVCYGHIEGVKVGDTYTTLECEMMLAKDLPRYEAMVNKCIHVPMPPHRKAAIVSFTYNVGGGALCKSTVARELNAGHVKAGCDALMRYTRSIGVVRKGLVNRRNIERSYCLRED